MRNRKKVILDMLLNIISTAVPTIILQLLILPSIANFEDENKYG